MTRIQLADLPGGRVAAFDPAHTMAAPELDAPTAFSPADPLGPGVRAIDPATAPVDPGPRAPVDGRIPGFLRPGGASVDDAGMPDRPKFGEQGLPQGSLFDQDGADGLLSYYGDRFGATSSTWEPHNSDGTPAKRLTDLTFRETNGSIHHFYSVTSTGLVNGLDRGGGQTVTTTTIVEVVRNPYTDGVASADPGSGDRRGEREAQTVRAVIAAAKGSAGTPDPMRDRPAVSALTQRQVQHDIVASGASYRSPKSDEGDGGEAGAGGGTVVVAILDPWSESGYRTINTGTAQVNSPPYRRPSSDDPGFGL